MLNKINSLYQLTFIGFKFIVDGDTLNVQISDGVSEKEKLYAREFIQTNIDFIISTLKNNIVAPNILNFNFVDNSILMPLSPAQERLWFIEKYEEGSNAYNIPMIFQLASNIDLGILEKSIKSIVSRHEILRTLIKEDSDSNGYQLVLDEQEHHLEIKQIIINSQDQFNESLKKEVNHIYDLSNEPPIRVCVYKVIADIEDNHEYYLSIVIHHIAFDGWSIDIFLRELGVNYNYNLNQSQGIISNIELPELHIQYKDFALWQKCYLTGERLNKQLSYWKDKLSDYEVLNIITDKPRPPKIDYCGGNINFELDEDTSSNLRKLAKELQVSLYSLLLAGYYLMLRIYSNQNDIVVGTPVANRHYGQVENLIGFFINSLALRIKIDSKMPINEFIRTVGDLVIEAQVYQDLPFEKLIEELKVDKDSSRHLIFQVMFGVQSFGEELGGKFGNKENEDKSLKNINSLLKKYSDPDLYNIAKFDISTFIDDSQLQLKGYFNYASSIYTELSIKGFIETYIEILKQLAGLYSDHDKLKHLKVRALNYLDTLQYEKIIYKYNQTDKEYPKDKTIHELFEEQVIKTTDKIALVYEKTELTYRELNDRANQLAHYLQNNYDIKQDTLVGLCLERDENMLIAILAVLKSGGAYVPMDPSYPDERIKYILDDTSTNLVLTNKLHDQRLQKINQINVSGENGTRITKVLSIDTKELQKQLIAQPITNPKTTTVSNNLAYIIYTSGTTGNPKGVMVEHRGVVNLKYHLTNRYGLSCQNSDEAIIQLANYVFDASVEQIVLALLNGYRLVLVPNQLWLASDEFYNYLRTNKVTHINATPSFIENYDFRQISSVKRLVLGGEQLKESHYNKLKCADNQTIINAYGPTEVTITSIVNIIKYNDLSIGAPIPNAKIYVLDSTLSPLPIGSIGELYIGGAGLTRGYLNRPDLTAERFIANPFRTVSEQNLGENSRLYKTGDLVRWRPDGKVEYIGRNDFQVKIRGYRIELGEIEKVLSRYKGIKQSVVVTKERLCAERVNSNTKYLVGYYITDNMDGCKLEEEEILAYLESKLPHYMIPTKLVNLSSLPLNINGKLDLKALPDAELTNDSNYVAPGSILESAICQIWASILGLDKNTVGIRDDFFRLGGNSILAIKLINKLNNELKSDVKIKDIFTSNTVEKLSKLVKGSIGNFIYKDYLITKTDAENLFKPFPLTNVQQAYYLGRFSNFELGNVSTHAYGEYQFSYLDIECLEKSFNQLLDRHLALRIIFKNSSQQYVEKYPYYKIKVNQLSNQQELINIRNDISNKVYDPDIFPLFDIMVSKVSNDYYILHISFDGLLMDGNSIAVLFDEWTKLYNNTNLALMNLSVNYRDYVLQCEKIRKSELFKKSERYWINKLDEYDFAMNLPVSADIIKIKKPKFTRISKIIKSEVWNKILYKAQQKRISPTAFILTIFGRMLCYWSGQEKVCINLTLFNRLPLHPQINEVLGDFTVLELFNYVDNKEDNIIKKLQDTHEKFWQDMEYSLFDGIDFQRLIKKEKSITNTQVIAPIVLTSVLGNTIKDLTSNDVFIDKSYKGEIYSITQTSQVWLDNKAYETDEGFIAEWDYVEQLFDKDVIEAMHHSYCNLIEHLANANWDTDELPVLSIQTQDKELIETINHSTQTLSRDTLFNRYESVIAENLLQNNIAVIDGTKAREYDYKTLLHDSDLLSRYIINKVNDLLQQPNSKLIGVLAEKGYNQVLSTLSIMKSGHGYLPLNIDWPIGRIDEVLEQGNVRILLISRRQYNQQQTKNSLSPKYTLLIIEDILVEIHDNNLLRSQLLKATLPIVNPDDIAYVIFTSGSTGKPKGVTISHIAALNTIDAVNTRFNVTSQDKILALSEFSFDLSVYDIFGILAVGGTIIFPDQDKAKDQRHWLELIHKNQITIWNTVPQLASLFIDEVLESDKYIDYLRLFLLSGDWIPTNLPGRIKNHFAKSTIMGLGGATEASIWSIWYPINEVKEEWNKIPYGIAMPNQKIYILNNYNQHCPIGVIGEIHIGGIGIALNYWNDEELTNASFINHNQFGRLYKTGDLGKLHKDGYIEFIGRKDTQVKLNGYRVELEEVSVKLSKLNGVKKAVVTIQKENSQDYIIGYLLPASYENKNQQELSINQDSFKIELHGIIQDLESQYQLKPHIDINQYKLRKSYRNFVDTGIDLSEVINTGNEVIANLKLSGIKSTTTEITQDTLTKVLATISAIKLEEKVLPKYRYPSAGSSYSVRCFLNIPNQLDQISSGYYYYNPCQYTLSQFSCNWQNGLTKNLLSYNELNIVINLPAIKPLYQDDAKKYAFIEVGHMLSLLLEELERNKISYDIEIPEKDLDDDNILAIRLVLGLNSLPLTPPILKPNYLYKENQKNSYRDLDENQSIDLENQNIFKKIDEWVQLLEQGKILFTLEGIESIENLIFSGLILQRISEKLYEKNIGSCMLGSIPYEGAIYSMILGKIDTDEIYKSESNIEYISLQKLINQELSRNLPEYMIPHDYIILNEFPLSTNGKLEMNKLPKLKIKNQSAYVPPKDKLEQNICNIWAKILEIPKNQVGTADNFFKLGGNSLLAMQVVRKLNRELRIEITLLDLYQCGTIRNIFDNFCNQDNIVNIRERGSI